MRCLRKLIAILVSIILIISSLSVVMFVTVQATQELITNGGFENGDTTGFFPRAGIASKTTVLAEAAHSGQYGVKISGYANSGYQNTSLHTTAVTVEKNIEYLWTFYVKFESGTTGYVAVKDASNNTVFGGTSMSNLKVTVDGGTTGAATSNYFPITVSDTEWHKVTVSFNSGNYESITLGYSNNGGAIVNLDDWSLDKVVSEDTDKLIKNGDFEKGDTTGFAPRAGIASKTLIATDAAKNGSYGIRIDGYANAGYQNTSLHTSAITVEKNIEYLWTFYVKFESGTTGYVAVKDASNSTVFGGTSMSNLKVTVDGGTTGAATSNYFPITVSDTEWHKVTVSFNSGNYESITLGYSNNGGAIVNLDDWSLDKVVSEDTDKLIKNGDFEKGDTTGFAPRAGIASKTTIIPNAAKNGSYGIRIEGYANAGYQNTSLHTTAIAVNKDSEYIWTFYVKFESGTTGYVAVKDASSSAVFGGTSMSNLKVTVDGGTTGTATSNYFPVTATDTEWHKVTVNFNSGSYEKIALGFSNYNGAVVCLDDWNLEEIIADKYYSVIINTSENGIVTGPSRVAEGEEAEFNITANDGYQLENLIINDQNVSNKVIDNKYTVTSVLNDIIISATFKKSDAREGNWGFEKGNVDGFLYRTGLRGKLSVVRDVAYEGDYSLKITGSGENASTYSNNTFFREVAVKENTDYKWTFRMKMTEGRSELIASGIKVTEGWNTFNGDPVDITFFDVSRGGVIGTSAEAGNFYPIFHGTDDWCLYTVEFNSGENDKVSLGYSNIHEGTVSYLDDWTFEEIKNESSNDIVKNGGFETGNLKYFSYNNGLKGKISVTDKDFHSGDYSVYIDAVGGNSSWTGNSVYQVVDVQPNTRYKWTFWVKFIDVGATGTAATLWIKDSDPKGTNMIYADAVSVTKGGSVLSSTTNGFYNMIFIDENWYQYTVLFDSGDNSKITLGYSSTYPTTKSYTDDWTLVEDTSYVPPVEAGVDEIKNNGFEIGNTQNWYFRSGVAGCSSVQSKVVHTGDYALKIGPVGNSAFTNNTVYQKVKVKPNSVYRWSIWVKIETSEKVNSRAAGLSTRIGESGFYGSVVASDAGSVAQLDANTNGYASINWNGKSDWYQYTITFISGEEETVQLTYSNQNKDLVAYIDDMEIVRLGDAPNSNLSETLLIDNDFEDVLEDGYSVVVGAEKFWSKSDKQAHSGKYSMQYDGTHDKGYLGLYWTDCFGNNGYTVQLKPNTTYRYSAWYKVVGNYEKTEIMLYTGDMTSNQYLKFKPDDTEWHYIEYIFTTPGAMTKKTAFRLAGAFHKLEATYLYVDDIKLEEAQPEILSDSFDNTYCEDYFNAIYNGSFEDATFAEDWKDAGFERIRNTISADDPGYYSAKLNGSVKFSKVFKVKAGATYTFAFSYKSNETDVKIGILANGKVLQPADTGNAKTTSMISLLNTSSKWERVAFNFVTPSSGEITLVIEGNANELLLDDICLFNSELGYNYNPNEYIPDEMVLKELQALSKNDEEKDEKPIKSDNDEVNNNIIWIALGSVIVMIVAIGIIIIIAIKKKRSK